MKRKFSLAAVERPNKDKRSVPYEVYPTWVTSRILSRSIKRDNGCIEYGGGNLKHKYGLISITLQGWRMIVPASRAMYMATNLCFELPRETVIRHKCDNPCCVNIDHLEAGTAKDNARDKIERGRNRRAGTIKPHTRQYKLTIEQVKDIKSKEFPPVYYVHKYGITNGYVSKLQKGEAKPLIVPDVVHTTTKAEKARHEREIRIANIKPRAQSTYSYKNYNPK